MKTNLTVLDPLAAQEVTISITVVANDLPRDERPVLLSIGVAEQLPILRTGTLGELTALVHEAWTAFGVHAQLAEVASTSETVHEEQVIATASVADEEPIPPSSIPLPMPKPQAKNLSLF